MGFNFGLRNIQVFFIQVSFRRSFDEILFVITVAYQTVAPATIQPP